SVLPQAPTATALTSTPNPSVAYRPVILTVTVTTTGGGPAPGGTVSFFDGTTLLGTGTADAGGVATLATSALTTGTHNMTAVRALDANFGTSASQVVTQNVIADLPALDPR